MTSANLLSLRTINTAGAALCFAMLGFGYYLQFVQGLEPCVLCIFQRLAILGLGIAFALAAFHNPRGPGRWVYGALIGGAASVGVALAGRHVWLQNLSPEDKAACGAGDWNYLMDVFGFTGTFARAWQGTGDCTEVAWQFLGLTIPGWTLVCLLLLGGLGLVRNWMRA